MNPEDVPDDLTDDAVDAWHDAPRNEHGLVILDDHMRYVLAAVLPAHERQVLTKLFGTPEDVAAREAEAAQRTPDDTVRLCEMARPGEHERQVRERVAAEISDPSLWPDPFGDWSAKEADAARVMRGLILARIARGES